MPKAGVLPELELVQPTDAFVYGAGQWTYDSRVADWFEEYKPQPIHHQDVILYREVARMSDGNDYQVHTLQPVHRKTDVPVVFTTAWLTSDRGHNRHTALHLAELGYPVIEIGPEGNYREPYLTSIGRLLLHPKESLQDLRQIELARTAHNIHQILDANGGHHFYDRQQVIFGGESRGAMVGMGLEAFSEEHDRVPLHADLSAPCFASALNIKEIWNYRSQIPRELGALGRIATSASLRKLRHYPDTLNLSPKAIAYQVFTGRTLFSGQAGEMARHIPLDRHMYITAFDGDIAGQGEQWRDDIFADHPGVTVDSHNGSHVSLAEQSNFDSFIGRLGLLVAELERVDDNGSEIDYGFLRASRLAAVA